MVSVSGNVGPRTTPSVQAIAHIVVEVYLRGDV